ncbi:M48 family metallopeptidase [uncultured Alistipes sp.]|uniref:M48 family metallopeptidase n=1 Tax=uncultured Alistipes sp. TaxID=538949 RepID=UPI002731E9DE|nr:M48 family metallopeptidase [uncultured Alistipes sp.]
MKNSFAKWAAALLCLVAAMPAQAQFNLKKAISGAAKVTQAATLTDEQMAAYVKEYIDWMDEHNPVCADDDPYTLRLNRLTEGLTDADGIALNFKVYYVIDVNAFACADGSIRVFSSLMDIMTDEELLGVIGHEVGHIAHRDSKKGFRTALLASALRDGISSNGGKAAQLSESQLGDLGEALANATYSQKQERDADDYGYEFLQKGGKNPWAMAYSFRRLKAMQEEAGAQKNSKINQLFSTHPDLDVRIKRMEERATADGIAEPTAACAE